MHNNFAWKYLTREAGPTRLIPVTSINVEVDVEGISTVVDDSRLTVNVVSSIEAAGQDLFPTPITQGVE